MSTTTLQYDLSTRTWTSPSGVAGTDWLPPLVFGASPTWDVQCTGPLPPGYADAQTWSLAVARDWLSSTQPMCRTSEGVAVAQTAGGLAITAPIDTATDRFLRVVDGLGDGLRCWMQVVGADASGAPCCHITLPLLCLPALDPHGAGGPLPPLPASPLTEADIQGMIDRAIAGAQGISSQAVAALSGASGTVEPGKCYSLDMSEDFELSVTALEAGLFGEALLFVRPNTHVFSVAAGIELDADMTNGSGYRLLVSWTPYGVKVEQSGEWIVA